MPSAPWLATIEPMTTPSSPEVPIQIAPGVRTSDAERNAVADLLCEAAAAGRLSMAEADERQAAAYAAVTREELDTLISDLPDARSGPPAAATAAIPTGPVRGPLTDAARLRLTVHAVIVGVLAVFLVTRWAMDPAPFFWPVWPVFWLGLSVFLHHRWAPRVTTAPTAA
jgi:hypothetical protein